MGEAAALGFRSHSGWAVAAVVAGSLRKPIVLDRRRMVLAEAAIPGAKQPYHAADRLDFEESKTLIERCRTRSTALATTAVINLIKEVKANGFEVIGAAVLIASGRVLPDLAAILKSHALIHTAEGEFFRDSLKSASKHCSLPVKKFQERDVWPMAATHFGLSQAYLKRCVGDLGRSLGPPWRQDEKVACLAAWVALEEWEARR